MHAVALLGLGSKVDAFSAFNLAFKGDNADQTTLLSLIKVCGAGSTFESTSGLSQAVLTFLSGDHTDAVASSLVQTTAQSKTTSRYAPCQQV